MIVEHRKYLNWIWFVEKPGSHLCSVYLQAREKVFRWTHVRTSFFTMVLDLTQSETTIRSNYSKKGGYEIRRAEKDGLSYEISQNAETLIHLFNQTAKAKKLEGLSSEKLRTKPESAITQISQNGEVLAAHYYLLDKEQDIVLLLYAASAYRKYQDTQKRYLAGRAHRLLYHKDFLYFKRQGYRLYDFGGYDLNSEDPTVIGVNKFKEDFGGQILRQYHYYPMWYYIFRQLRFLWKNMYHRL